MNFIADADRRTLGSAMESSVGDVNSMAIGFPGVENFRSPFGSNIDPLSGSIASQLGITNEVPSAGTVDLVLKELINLSVDQSSNQTNDQSRNQ